MVLQPLIPFPMGLWVLQHYKRQGNRNAAARHYFTKPPVATYCALMRPSCYDSFCETDLCVLVDCSTAKETHAFQCRFIVQPWLIATAVPSATCIVLSVSAGALQLLQAMRTPPRVQRKQHLQSGKATKTYAEDTALGMLATGTCLDSSKGARSSVPSNLCYSYSHLEPDGVLWELSRLSKRSTLITVIINSATF